MNEIHCHICGGSISDPATVSYRLASVPVIPAKVSGTPCRCALAIVYGPPAAVAVSIRRKSKPVSVARRMS